MNSIEEFQVKNAPDSVYYVPDFISENEEHCLLEAIRKTPGPRKIVISHFSSKNTNETIQFQYFLYL